MRLVCTIIALCVLLGCGAGVTHVAVSGDVTFDGEPVQDGQIALEPQGAGTMVFGVITAGRYSIPAEYGPQPGNYLVRITANRPTGKQAAKDAFLTDDVPLEINEQFIPAKYNTGSKLEIQIENSAKVTKDFHLTSK